MGLNIRRILTLLSSFALVSGPALGQTATTFAPSTTIQSSAVNAAFGTKVDVAGGNSSATNVTVTGGVNPQTEAARWMRAYDPRDYGANCSGTSQTMLAKLGLSTKAAIAAYTAANGSHPYAWLTANSYFNYQVNLQIAGDTPSGVLKLVFTSVAGIPVGPTVTVAGNGIAAGSTVASAINVASNAITGSVASASTAMTVSSSANLVVGEIVPSIAGIPWNTSIAAIPSGTTITLSKAATSAVASATAINFPAVGVVTLSTATTAAIKGRWTGGNTIANPAIINVSQPLTDAQAAAGEMDFYGLEAAIYAASGSVMGTGAVLVPNQRCIMVNSAMVGTGLGNLVIPEANSTIVGTLGNPVDIVGQGQLVSQLYWPVDLGVGRAGIINGNPNGTWANGLGRYAATATYYGRIYNLTLNGIGSATITPGTQTAWMDGAWLGARRDTDHVEAQHFNAGIARVGDNFSDEDDELAQNHCGYQFQAQNTTLSGAITWNRLRLTDNDFAGVCVSRNAEISAAVINTLDLTNDPYGFLFEAGLEDTTGTTGIGADAYTKLMNVRMTNVIANTLGNAFWMDDGFTTADGLNHGSYNATYASTVCDDCIVNYNSAKTITSGGRGTYQFVMGSAANGVEFTHVPPYTWFTYGAFSAMTQFAGDGYQNGGLRFSGDGSSLAQPNFPIQIGSNTSIYAPGLWKWITIEMPGVWSGYTEIFNGSGTPAIAQGDIIEQVSGGIGGQLGTASTNLILGVAVQSFTGIGSGTLMVLATTGKLVNVLTTTSPTVGTYIKKAASGLAQAASGPTDTGVIGVVVRGCSGSANPYTCPVQLTFPK